MAPACAGKLKDDMDELSAAAPSTRINIVPPEIWIYESKKPDSNFLRKLIRQIFNRRFHKPYLRNPPVEGCGTSTQMAAAQDEAMRSLARCRITALMKPSR